MSIDDVLSAMAEELGGEPDEDEPAEDTVTEEEPPEITPEDDQTADEEVDSVLADLEQEIEVVSGAEETPAPVSEPKEKPEVKAKPANEDEQIVADEIAAKEDSESDEDAVDESVPKPNYDHFPPPARLLLKTTSGVNKPFFFLPDAAKDTLGLVAVITLIVSMIAAALILLCS